MNKYKHISINPSAGQTISDALKPYQNTEWALHHVLPVTEYEWILVLERWDSWADDKPKEIPRDRLKNILDDVVQCPMPLGNGEKCKNDLIHFCSNQGCNCNNEGKCCQVKVVKISEKL